MRAPRHAWALAATFAVCSLTTFNPTASERDFADRYARFQLFNDCRPMNVVVNGPFPLTEIALTLTVESLKATVESHLRGARLFCSGANSYLHVSVDLWDRAWSIRLSFNKVVLDEATLESFPVPTWRRGTTSIHANDANHVREEVAELIDEFIQEYLKVNHDACSAKLPSKKAAQ